MPGGGGLFGGSTPQGAQGVGSSNLGPLPTMQKAGGAAGGGGSLFGGGGGGLFGQSTAATN